MIAERMLAAHALILDRPAEEQQQRLAVVQEAMCWLRTPYHHRARVMGAGVDCGMLLTEVYEGAGVTPHVEPAEYPADWMLHRSEERFLGIVETYAQKVDAPLPGDIALFRWGRCISHGSIVVAWPEIVHAYIHAGEVVLDDAVANQELAERLVGFWSPWAKGWDEVPADTLGMIQPGEMVVPAWLAKHLSEGA
ncbi:hypothetical protein [Geothrix campi]|uniref:hypothetical protein n=1 Tax=Geothrix campi TaxID=2966450 RepID=UPI0021482949|nr:hypothetical protein [Geothrix sp. SG10]